MTIKTVPVVAGLSQARELASRHGHETITMAHVAKVWITGGEPFLSDTCDRQNVPLRKIEGAVDDLLADLPMNSAAAPVIDPGLERTLHRALEFEGRPTDHEVSVPSVLYQVLADRTLAVGRSLRSAGLRCALSDLTGQSRGARTAATPPEDHPNTGTGKSTDRYLRDVTEEVRRGLVAPVIGREAEIRQVCAILRQGRVPSAMLVGSPGVGKTAIVEGIAAKVVAGHASVPGLERVVELDLSAFLGGTAHRGAVEERVSELLRELERSKPRTLLFIDEVHMLFGAGQAAGGADLANLLKSALARGRIRVIAATTEDEYCARVEPDGAFRRRFQKVRIEEPTAEALVEILERVAPGFEEHHGVAIPREGIPALVRLCRAHQPDRRNPDKAIQTLDLAASLSSVSETTTGIVGPREVAEAIAERAGIPVERMTGMGPAALELIHTRLESELVGQEKLCKALTKTIEHACASHFVRRGPWMTVGLVGPAGLGLERIPGLLAGLLANRADRSYQISLAQCADRQGVDRLLGAAPGLVGYEEGGQLTEPMRRDPYSILVLEGSGTTHPTARNVALQMFTNGYLTDGRGRRVDYSQSVVIVRCQTECEEPQLLAACEVVLEAAPLGDEHLLEIARVALRAGAELHRPGVSPPELLFSTEAATRLKIDGGGPCCDRQAFEAWVMSTVFPALLDHLVPGTKALGIELSEEGEFIARAKSEGAF